MQYINQFLEKIINFDYIWFLSDIFSMMTFESFLKLVVIYFFIVWIAIIIWVTKDIINRTNNIFYQIFSIFTVLLWTPLWIVVYLLIRPSKTLFEKYYEEATIEEDFDLNEFSSDEKTPVLPEIWEKYLCPHCSYTIQQDYKFCPNCRACLKKNCTWCLKELNPKWTICPYCWKDQEEKVNNILNEKQKETKNKKSKENIKIEEIS